MAASSIRVKVEQGPKKGRRYKMKRDELVLGSSEAADVTIPAEGVDPRHAQLSFAGGQVRLEDLDSQAGTFRNGQLILGPVQVFPGDRIGLGPNVTLILQGDDPGTEPAPDENELPGELGLAAQETDL